MNKRTIVLIRHGIAEDKWWFKDDYDRVLVEAWRQWLVNNIAKEKNILEKLEVIYCSWSVRTRQTLDVLQQSCNISWVKVVFDDCIYEKEWDRRDICDLIKNTSEDVYTVAIVGHNPTISELYSYLAPWDAISLKKGDIVTIRTEKKWYKI